MKNKKRRIAFISLFILGMLYLMGSVFCVSADQNYITTPVHIAFTKDEKDYIKENNSIQVALVEGFPLICEYNESEEKYEGIVMDALEQISERAGLQFQYTELPKDVLPWEYLESHPDTIMAPLLVNSIINYMDEMEILNTIVKSRMVAVSREGKAIDLDGKFVIVVPENLYGFEEKIYEKFPKAQIVYSSSHKDGLDMVNSAEADMTFVNEISGVYMLQSPYYSKLVITNTANFVEDVALTVSADANPRLISVMNKTISSLSERDVQQIVVNNMVSHSYEMSIQEWLYKNGAFIILLSIAVGGMIFSINRRQKQEKEEKQRIKIAEERHKKDVEYQKKMFYQANFDALTGLYNKNYFIEKAAELLEENPDVVYSFFRLNVKKFKMINEIYGQERGDIVLTKIADKLREDIGKEGVYGRVYSDHFAICYPVDEETLRKVRKVKVAHLNCKGQDIRVEINLGVYVNSSHYSDVVQLLDYAQIALQNEEKSNQQNMYFYKDCYMETLLRNQKITNEMENALRDKQFHIFLQPQFDHIEKKLVGAEALIRWFHPVEGMIPPNEFIPVFEGNRFIYKLDVYVCEEVCRLLAKWKEQGKLVPVSVNLSRIDLQNAGLLHMLQSTLEKYSIPIHYLHLEVTESAYVENYEEMLHVIEELREAGFLIEMDDFGSGYSSLNMLKDIPVDIIKLDMRFFGGETHMDKGGNIIETIVNLAHSLGLYVIAEGVETKREANFLQSIQCHMVQGYLYGKPMPVNEFEKLLADSTVGEKMVEIHGEDTFDNRYWNIEKFNVLLNDDRIILFDYDPSHDRAVFISMREGKTKEKVEEHYLENLYENPRIHSDSRDVLEKILQSRVQSEKEIDILADYEETGNYEWYHITIHGYYKQEKFNRVIAVIKKKEIV